MHNDVTHVQGSMDGSGQRIGVDISRFNSLITEQLYSGAEDTLTRHGVKPADLTVVHVPGSYEIGLVARRLAARSDIDAVICLGAVIRGDTPHFDHVAREAARSVSSASEESGKPVIFGVLTTDTVEQALQRAGVKGGNKGADAAQTAIETVNVLRSLA